MVQESTVPHFTHVAVFSLYFSHCLLSVCACLCVHIALFYKDSVQFSSVAQSCPTLRYPMNHSMPGLPCLQSFPASESFPVSQLFASGGQSIGASDSASVLPMNIQGWTTREVPKSVPLLKTTSLGIPWQSSHWDSTFSLPGFNPWLGS